MNRLVVTGMMTERREARDHKRQAHQQVSERSDANNARAKKIANININFGANNRHARDPPTSTKHVRTYKSTRAPRR